MLDLPFLLLPLLRGMDVPKQICAVIISLVVMCPLDSLSYFSAIPSQLAWAGNHVSAI